MCETRRNNRPPRDQESSGETPTPRQQQRRPRSSGPAADSTGEFTQVVRRRPNNRVRSDGASRSKGSSSSSVPSPSSVPSHVDV